MARWKKSVTLASTAAAVAVNVAYGNIAIMATLIASSWHVNNKQYRGGSVAKHSSGNIEKGSSSRNNSGSWRGIAWRINILAATTRQTAKT